MQMQYMFTVENIGNILKKKIKAPQTPPAECSLSASQSTPSSPSSPSHLASLQREAEPAPPALALGAQTSLSASSFTGSPLVPSQSGQGTAGPLWTRAEAPRRDQAGPGQGAAGTPSPGP